jgi:hypothetical protein
MTELKVKLQEEESCVTGFISWGRLERQLRASGELRKSESITHLVADEVGIKYYVKEGE